MITRRAALLGTITLAAMPSFAKVDTQPTPDTLIEQARLRATRPYQPPSRSLVPPFDELDYDAYRGIRPISGRAARLPIGPNFQADLMPPGWLFREPVRITLPGHETQFSYDLFDFDPALVTLPDPRPDTLGMGFSGLRLLHSLNRPGIWDEVLVLQGASYFRALARDTVYGLSARALALGTGGNAPEEFPVTEEIHVFSADDVLRFGCLIDSPRTSAALIATLKPGAATRMTCSLHLFPREPLEDAGIAPLTSMFQHNALGPARIDDFRPAVHDSAVLVIDNGAGERLWRPLANPARLQMSAFIDENPRGFGLLQEPASFEAFRDAEASYHRRPSAWITPVGDWGRGAVHLLEIPTEDEFADNIVAFWRPEGALDPGEHRFEYDLDWVSPGLDALPAARYPARFVRSASGVEPNSRTGRLFVLDVAIDPSLTETNLDMRLDASEGARIEGPAFYPVPEHRGLWRASFILGPDDGTDVAEIRMTLQGADGRQIAPVWLYRWTRSAGDGV